MTAAGDILYASGANTLAKLAKGSDTEVLTLASGVPSWAAPAAGGAWTKIESQTASDDGDIDFTTFSSDYLDFKMIGSNVVPASDGQDCWVRLSTGSSFISSGYSWGQTGVNSAATIVTNNSTSDSKMIINYAAVGNVGGENIYFEVTISDVHDTVNQKMVSWRTAYRDSGNINVSITGSGSSGFVTACDGMRFKFGGSNVATGEITLYGRKVT